MGKRFHLPGFDAFARGGVYGCKVPLRHGGSSVFLLFWKVFKKSSAMVPAAMYNRAVPLAKEREYRNGVSKSWWRGVGEDLGIISAYRDNSPPAII